MSSGGGGGGGVRQYIASFADDHLHEKEVMMSGLEIERLRNALKKRSEVLARKEAAVEWREDCIRGREELVVRQEVSLSEREFNCSEFELGSALSGQREGGRV